MQAPPTSSTTGAAADLRTTAIGPVDAAPDTALTPISSATPASPDIYLLAAHPAWRESRVNRLMKEAAEAIPRVQVRDLYSDYPDYAIDIEREQQALAGARLVVLLHPLQWYAMPALQKLWMDEVLTYGWAYGEGGDALRGKDLLLATTTGGPETSYRPDGYNRYFFDAFMPAYEQSATVCGMRFLPPMVLHGAHHVTRDEVLRHVATFAERLQTYPDWPELQDLDSCPDCLVPADDRPVLEHPDILGQVLRKNGGSFADFGAAPPVTADDVNRLEAR